MTVNAKISKGDYNQIQSLISSVLGTGSGTFGYGQTVRSSQVSESNKITINEWARLREDILSCYLHTTNASPANPQAAVNTIIRSNETNSPYTRYKILADEFLDVGFRMTAPPAGRFTLDTYPVSSTTWPGIYGEYWRTQTQSIIRLEWTNSNNARAFFNSGGRFRIQTRRTNGNVSTQNSEWTALLNSAGTQEWGGNVPSGGTGETQTINGSNFYRLDNQFRTFYTISKTGTYSANSYTIQARAVNATNNNNSTGTASIIEFRILWTDDFNSTSPGSPDRVDGNLEVLLSNTRAVGSLFPSGVFTIQQPTVTITPPAPVGIIAGSTYSITPSSTSVNEGSSVTFTVNTTNVPNNTRLYWTIFGGPNVTSGDFVATSGNFLINNNTGSATVSLVADNTTEGSEFFYLELRSGSTSGPIIATSRSIFINDTSFTQVVEIASGDVTSTTNLRTFAINNGWDQIQRLEFIVRSGVRLVGTRNDNYNGTDTPLPGTTSRHRNTAGLVVEGSYPNGLIIRNQGSIFGRGGTGGNGGLNANGDPGRHGGSGIVFVTGISATFINLINTGLISGGGGGGGGGATTLSNARGGGGGGGAPLGTGGTGGTGSNGTNATILIRGSGGNADLGFSAGGHGGSWATIGANGSGQRPNGTRTGGAAGPGGFSIVGNSAITNTTNTGTILGTQVSTLGLA